MIADKNAAAREPFHVIGDSVDRERWLEARNAVVGGSDAPSVLGVEGAFSCPLEVWGEKVGRIKRSELDQLEHVFWGNQLEHAIIAGYAIRAGRQTVPFGLLIRSERWPWMGCTPDGLVSDVADLREAYELREAVRALRENYLDRKAMAIVTSALLSGRWWPLQTKNIGLNSASAWEDGVPLYYRVQCVHEALVCGSSRVTGAALVAGQRLVWEDIDVDTSLNAPLERQIVNLTRDFVERYVRPRVEPPAGPSKSAERALKALYPSHTAQLELKLGGEAQCRAYELDLVKDKISALEDRERELENAIKQELRNAESCVFPDGSGYTFRTSNRRGYAVAPTTVRQLRRKAAKEK